MTNDSFGNSVDCFAYFLMLLTVVLLNKLTGFLTSLTVFLISLT